ncbi:predicted protein [Chaetoceros tenuissimus]|uniref:Uncharacterized protein n=1 Tax=Chaetoceros tenuissimus TaxID=426638 RepID=A0AAD3CD99_9STRA|nr:predicted protein [Chaetoceros tenuissimus]
MKYISNSIFLGAAFSISDAAAHGGVIHSNYTCLVECTGADPCGDGMGQTNTCLSATLYDATAYGFGSMATEFLGCSATKCNDYCDGYDKTLTWVASMGALCFPKKDDMMDNTMFTIKDDAMMAAIARGCSGSHYMPDAQKHMIGDNHDDCDSSFSEPGVEFSGAPSSASSFITFTSLAIVGVSFVVSLV